MVILANINFIECVQIWIIFFFLMLIPSFVTGMFAHRFICNKQHSIGLNAMYIVIVGLVTTGLALFCFFIFAPRVLLPTNSQSLLRIISGWLLFGVMCSFLLSIVRYVWLKKIRLNLIDNVRERIKTALFFAFLYPSIALIGRVSLIIFRNF